MARKSGNKNKTSNQTNDPIAENAIGSDLSPIDAEELPEALETAESAETAPEEGLNGVVDVDQQPNEQESDSDVDLDVESDTEVSESSGELINEPFNLRVTGATLPQVIEKVLDYAYKGAEFGNKYPNIKKWPYTVEMQHTGLSDKEVKYDPSLEYYSVIVRGYNPVDFIKNVIELGKQGAVINLRDIGVLAKGAFQIKLLSRVPVESTVYGITCKPRAPIVDSVAETGENKGDE